MVNHQHRCIFVHIPKTAGNSINRVFGLDWADHKDLQRYFQELPRSVFDSYFKFAVVRNPWDRLLSDYNYQRKKSREKESKLFVFTEKGSKRNFAEWAELALSDGSRFDARRWGGEVSPTIHRWSPQLDWITVDGKPQVDFVGRIENLQDDFSKVCTRIGLPQVRVPHRNRRLHWHYSHYYDRTTRDLVGRYYARDVEAFGYEFERAILKLHFSWPGKKRTISSSGTPHLAANVAAAPTFSCAGVAGAKSAQPIDQPLQSTRFNWLRPSALAAAGSALVAGLMGSMHSDLTSTPKPGVANHGFSSSPQE